MARVRLLRDIITGERYVKEADTGMSFRRVVGALVWPYENRPGCLVVLGETRSPQSVLGARRHDVHKLEESRSRDVSVLTAGMARMTEDWLVRQWATPMSDRRVYLLDDANDEQRRLRRPLLRFGDPQGWQGHGEGLLPFLSCSGTAPHHERKNAFSWRRLHRRRRNCQAERGGYAQKADRFSGSCGIMLRTRGNRHRPPARMGRKSKTLRRACR